MRACRIYQRLYDPKVVCLLFYCTNSAAAATAWFFFLFRLSRSQAYDRGFTNKQTFWFSPATPKFWFLCLFYVEVSNQFNPLPSCCRRRPNWMTFERRGMQTLLMGCNNSTESENLQNHSIRSGSIQSSTTANGWAAK